VRADLKFIGVDHSGSSFTARVYLNNPAADESAATDASAGYAGSFHIFGHGRCFGDEGHCDVMRPRASAFDRRRPHQLTPTTKIVVITDALNRIVTDVAQPITVTVTVVPIVRKSALAQPGDAADILHVASVQVLTYD
jgi:tyrosinase